ncbi:MAG: hypothetical protein LBU67_05290 [Oscillospiraceae bacterium]|jgi:hypothetical protein|nr:hypothetical protein [Oscillospiraceae bacterium]
MKETAKKTTENPTPLQVLETCRKLAQIVRSLERQREAALHVGTDTSAPLPGTPGASEPGDPVGLAVARRDELLRRIETRLAAYWGYQLAAEAVLERLCPLREQGFARDYWVGAMSVQHAAALNGLTRRAGYRVLARVRGKLLARCEQSDPPGNEAHIQGVGSGL